MKQVFTVRLAVAFILLSFTAIKARGDEQQAPPLPRTNGLIREWMTDHQTRWEVNGKDVSERKGRAAIAGDDQVPDDSKFPSLTLIGSKEDTSKLRKSWNDSAEVKPLVERFLVQEFNPENPLIRRAGFATGGKPTIYAEMPDGRVLFRLNEYPGDAEFVRTVAHALQVAEGVRKPQDGYTPANDPGLLPKIQPKIDAEVTPSPATLMATHLAAFLGGMVMTVVGGGGGWLLLRKLLAAAVAAEVAKAATPASSPTPATK